MQEDSGPVPSTERSRSGPGGGITQRSSAPPSTDGGSDFLLSPPAVSLPKGGGAVRGIGEKFSSNPVTGTGAMSIPIALSPGRGGFGPQLALTYDSGAAQSVFGLGWNLALPSIVRKTDKGLPRYLDAEESDVFLLSGAEDLVPFIDQKTGNRAVLQARLAGILYNVHRYRPRIEGLFARIERWTAVESAGTTFWRTISRDNVTTWYGRDNNSQIFDPRDPRDSSRIFQWLICQTNDDKGNVAVYEYLDDTNLAIDTTAVWEANRDPKSREANRYLKRIRYGNPPPSYLPKLDPVDPDKLPTKWMFEAVFDYGDHVGQFPTPQPDDPPTPPRHGPPNPLAPVVRPDPFSSHRSGFEVRTYRLCRRVLMFHHFADAPVVGLNCLVRSTDFDYELADTTSGPSKPSYSMLRSVTQWSFQSKADQSTEPGAVREYESRQLPPVVFTYSQPVVKQVVKSIDAAELENLPVGTQGPGYRWIDLDGEGLSGVLTEATGAWYYKPGLGDGKFGPVRAVARVPAMALAGGSRHQFMDLAGDGEIDVVDFGGPTPGFHERDRDEGWKRHVPFASLPNIDWQDPNLRFVDLTGDGHADALVTEQDVFTWYPSLDERGFDAAERTRQQADEDAGPKLIFADGTQTIFLADMCGDGLTDLVRIRNGEVCYWPNQGYGRFGRKVTLGNSPRFDSSDLFDPSRIRLTDIDGSGPIDIIYLGRDGAQLYFNRAGNSLSDALPVDLPIATTNLGAVQVADLLGNGTACLVWNSHLPADTHRPVYYIDLMGGASELAETHRHHEKPHLLIQVDNNLGATTDIEYTPSTRFYLQDRQTDTPWVTRLPFPVHCVSKVTVRDKWRGTAFSSTYSYHHGYFDGAEREFRGFGRVEQVDTQAFSDVAAANVGSPYVTTDKTLYQPPVKTITWFHTGIAMDRERILGLFAGEYLPARYAEQFRAAAYSEPPLPQPVIDPGKGTDLTTDEWREAMRACKGMPLRQEVYELDFEELQRTGQHVPVRIFSAAEHSCHIARLQPQGGNRHAVFLATTGESFTCQYELDLRPQALSINPRIAHTFNLRFDSFGRVLQSVAVVYPRRVAFADPNLSADQVALINKVQRDEQHIAYTESRFTGELPFDLHNHRPPLPCELRTYELTGTDPNSGFVPKSTPYFTTADFLAYHLSDFIREQGSKPVGTTEYHLQPADQRAHMRLVEHGRTLYFDAGPGISLPNSKLPFGSHDARALKYEDYKLALTDSLLAAVFGSKLQTEVDAGLTAGSLLADSAKSGYIPGTQIDPSLTGQYWMRSGVAGFGSDTTYNARGHFYLPVEYIDPFNNRTRLKYDDTFLFARETTDALGNSAGVVQFDYRTLAPARMRDANHNESAVAFDVHGLPVVSAKFGKVTPGTSGAAEATETGETLEEFGLSDLNLPPAKVSAFFDAQGLDGRERDWIGKAAARFVYHFGEQRDQAGAVTQWAARPAASCSILREQHERDLANIPGNSIPIQIAVEYTDGSGQAFVKKVQAEPESVGGPLRWIANGKTIVNNKGKPVLQYEPYFSIGEDGMPDRRFQEPKAMGVSPVMFYDAPGRLIRTEFPDGTLSRVEFSPWFSRSFDANDTVLESPWYRENGRNALPPDEPLPTPPFVGRSPPTADERSGWLTAQHANTPAEVHFDSLGREVFALAHNRTPDADGTWRDAVYLTFTKIDAEGKPLWICDARGNLVMQYITPTKPNHTPLYDDPNSDWSPAYDLPANASPCYDIAGNLLFQHSMDAGDRWMLMDAAGRPMLAWDANEAPDASGARVLQARVFRTQYDELHRPAAHWLKVNAAAPTLIEAFEHLDTNRPGPLGLATALERNLVGQVVAHWDPAGQSTVERIDVTGQPAHVTRTLIRLPGALADDPAIMDWSASLSAPLDSERFELVTERDALGRVARTFNWHRGTGARVAVFLPAYNARGMLASNALVVRALKTATGNGYALQADSVSSTPIKAIEYDAKGQKLSMTLGNGATTRYIYDPGTFRLTRLYTRRTGAAFASDCDDDPDAASPARACGVQNLVYVYDAIGNITHVQDDAQQTIWFRNAQVEPSSDYVYDAVYRLIEATGRENAAAVAPPRSHEDPWPTGAFPTADATRNYTERYTYDAAGNFTTMQHRPGGAAGWTRHYQHAPDSNRLASTWYGSATTEAVVYGHDTHGNVLNLNRLTQPPPVAPEDEWGRALEWDWRDMIRGLDMVGGGGVRYHHSMDKVRSRKHIRRVGGVREDRVYLGTYELYRRTDVNGNVVEEIDSLHLFVGEQRVLLVDDVLSSDAGRPDGLVVRAPRTLFRYQFGAFLASAALELDEEMRVISYEEFHPYGTSAFRLMDRASQAPPRRYRFAGLERDEESSLNAQGARCCAPWLGRWLSPDPSELADGSNLYAYVHANPIAGTDRDGRETFMNIDLFAARHPGTLLNDAPAPAVSPISAGPAPAEPTFLDQVKSEFDPPVVVPQGYMPPIMGGYFDTYIDRSVVRADVAAKASLDLLTSGSIMVEPSDRAGAALRLVVSEAGYLSAGLFALVEHFGASVLGTLGAGLNAIEKRVPGFQTTLESLQGVPALGPEVNLAQMSMRLAASRLLLGLEMSQMTRTAPAAQIFAQLTQEEISNFANAGRHVLQVEHLDSGLQFFTVSGPGGALGHTEYVSAMFLNELGQLEQGSTILLSGIYAPCTRSGGCSALLGQLARERGINFMYLARGTAMSGLQQGAGRALPRGISFFEGGVGRVLKTGVPSQISAPPHVRLGIRTSLDW